MRKLFIEIAIISLIVFASLAYFVWNGFWWFLGVVVILTLWGIYDMFQTKHSLIRNFPLFGRARWVMEALRPKLYQYFVESDTDGRPINRMTEVSLPTGDCGKRHHAIWHPTKCICRRIRVDDTQYCARWPPRSN